MNQKFQELHTYSAADEAKSAYFKGDGSRAQKLAVGGEVTLVRSCFLFPCYQANLLFPPLFSRHSAGSVVCCEVVALRAGKTRWPLAPESYHKFERPVIGWNEANRKLA